MQHNFVYDVAGRPGGVTEASPRWLRLSRTKEKITAQESPDGITWTTVGTANLPGLPATVQAGLFVTSPQFAEVVSEQLGMSGAAGGPTQATAVFDRIDLQGSWSGTWSGDTVGGSSNMDRGGFEENPGGFTVTGSGDIAPAVAGAAGIGTTITQTLVGTFAGLIIVVVIGAMFATGEYRRDLIRTTLAATPRRGRVLAAKAVVIGTVTYLTGLAAAAVVVYFGQDVLRDNGAYVHPATTAIELRVIAGTAALLAVAAVLALALGALVRRGATAVTAAIVTIVLPYLLAMTVLPASAAQWLLKVTPAAAFAVQQSAVRYPQVDNLYTPAGGYFPLAPWAGFAVLAAWGLAALGLAWHLLRRRDA
jgi:ABC-2 family transporter protein